MRTVGTVNAGVYFFSPPLFLRQEPRRQERERLMVMPAKPVANLILRQARVVLRPLQAFGESLLPLCRETIEIPQSRYRGAQMTPFKPFKQRKGLHIDAQRNLK